MIRPSRPVKVVLPLSMTKGKWRKFSPSPMEPHVQKKKGVRLCSIYLFDVLGFLPRIDVDKCRRVSDHCDEATTQRSPEELPLHKHNLLKIGICAVGQSTCT